MKVLNLYAGVGGNRKHWKNCEVVAVESNQDIARVYQRQYPNDEVVIGDAHEYLREHFREFDFIWSSPPCQTHSKMAKATRHKNRKFPDMRLYEEILFLQHFFKGKYIVENVAPFYEPLVSPTKQIGRHLFWGNFDFEAEDVKRPSDFINLANLGWQEGITGLVRDSLRGKYLLCREPLSCAGTEKLRTPRAWSPDIRRGESVCITTKLNGWRFLPVRF